MSPRLLFSTALFALLNFITLPNLSISDDSSLPFPTVVYDFVDDKYDYRAGETAILKPVFLKGFKSEHDKHLYNPNITSNFTTGNSSFITGVYNDFGNPDMSKWRMYFIPITVGLFNMFITEDHFSLSYSTLHYNVAPGSIYEPGGIVSWMGRVENVVAGTKATVLILPKDAFGNTVTPASEGQKVYDFVVYATHANGSNANLLDMKYNGWNEFGYISIEFIAVTAGSLSVHVKHQNLSLIGSPLQLTVHPAALDIGNCMPQWSADTKSFQLFSRMETFVHLRDRFGNLVPRYHEFNFEVMKKGTNLPIPLSDLQYKEVSPGIQLFSFRAVEPGDFLLIITDKDMKNQIMNMPYEFNIYVGYCDDSKSIVNGSGLENSLAGEASKFYVSLRDAYQYPSPIELEKLHVQITLASSSIRVYPQIYPRDSANGTQPTEMLSYGAFGSTGVTSSPFVYSHDNSAVNSETSSSEFEVVYVPEKEGVYEILIFCGNVPLNGGRPFLKAVDAGKVNISMSAIVQLAPNASANIVNYFLVKLLDSFSNPVLYQETKLLLKMASLKQYTHFFACNFEDNYDGTYTGSYLALDPGPYEMCISYDGQRILPWPFGVNTFDSHYFPECRNDEVQVWEDESIGFYALENDIFVGGDATISDFQKPSHGSLVQNGIVFRYTPYKRFYGNDEFMYTIKDVNGNVASGRVKVYVLTIPPQFVSFPTQLQATEDLLSPKFGGFPKIEIIYSDSLENISVMLSAQNGTVFLSPTLMQFWEPVWDELSVSKEEGMAADVYLTGRLEVLNFALRLLKYIGDENFSGDDVITVTTMNKNGRKDLDIPIFVEPINDPPFIHVPEFILLDNEKEDEGFLIFDKHRDKFNFSIGDPDHLHFTGNKTHFRVMFSLEVTSGYFSAKLPAHLISTTELKLKGSKQWQPLQTFVEISRHFTINKAKGIKFQGTINDCNSLLHQLLYYGDKHDGVLKVSVNDMGWYGCYPDCAEGFSVPLISEATVNLITRTPMNSLVAHSLGSLIVIESIVLILLAVSLMFFTCKCIFVLGKKKHQVPSQNLQLHEVQSPHEQALSAGSSEHMTQLTGNFPSSFTQSDQPSNLLKLVEETDVAEVATMTM